MLLHLIIVFVVIYIIIMECVLNVIEWMAKILFIKK
nr:MAG TPA: hypothetical protein [Crassvirales sp.]